MSELVWRLAGWGAYLLFWSDTLAPRHPFNDHIIASGSDDGKIFIWQVPQDFTLLTDAEEPADVAPVSKLAGHSRYDEAP